jgi:hypothetical protein
MRALKDHSRMLALYGAAALGLLALVVIVLGLGTLPAARAASDTLYTFETGIEGWQPCTSASCAADSSAVTVTQSLSHTTEGSYSLRLDFDHASGHSKAIYQVDNGAGWDFSNRDVLKFDLWKQGEPAQVAIALSTGSGWVWHESRAVDLEDGDNAISINLKDDGWKTAASGWNYGVPVQDLDQVYRINLLRRGLSGQRAALFSRRAADADGHAASANAGSHAAAPSRASRGATGRAEPVCLGRGYRVQGRWMFVPLRGRQ